MSPESDFRAYRRRLPHWRLGGATYFVTWRLQPGLSPLGPAERDVVAAALQHFQDERYRLLAYVHVLVHPFPYIPLQEIVHSWKSYTANRLQRLYARVGAIWQDEHSDRVVRDEDELLEKAEYMLGNPRTRWPESGDYVWARWCGAGDGIAEAE